MRSMSSSTLVGPGGAGGCGRGRACLVASDAIMVFGSGGLQSHLFEDLDDFCDSRGASLWAALRPVERGFAILRRNKMPAGTAVSSNASFNPVIQKEAMNLILNKPLPVRGRLLSTQLEFAQCPRGHSMLPSEVAFDCSMMQTVFPEINGTGTKMIND